MMTERANGKRTRSAIGAKHDTVISFKRVIFLSVLASDRDFIVLSIQFY